MLDQLAGTIEEVGGSASGLASSLHQMRYKTVKKEELNYGDEVVIPWGFTEVHGRVAEVYGHPDQRRVIVALEPELSSYVVDEPTTVSVPLTDVKKVVSAG